MPRKNEKESIKLKLEDLKVQSFTTMLRDEEKLMIKGGLVAETQTICNTGRACL